MVSASMNSQINESINETPHYVLFGEDKSLPYQLLRDDPQPVYNAEDYCKVRTKDFQLIYRCIKKELTAYKEEMIKKANKRLNEVCIIVGDIGFLLNKKKNTKLDARFVIPIRVEELMGNAKVKICFLYDNNPDLIGHRDWLK